MTYKEIHVTDAKANLITLLVSDEVTGKPGLTADHPACCDLQGRAAARLDGNRFRLSDGTIVWASRPLATTETLNA
ncbi:hypothetical protein IMZ29_11395 [Achromobacter sp. GG226]|uniref:hypothetical protein n=1 Tax=Verticiella alkaliphila TaxID=2779529 RepID=UPI001C0CBAA0|nr:hypothetical protein [Verticiella sp. GG226]MBU4611114.1 hypothetical protein [Verticiella sp. GG226]